MINNVNEKKTNGEVKMQSRLNTRQKALLTSISVLLLFGLAPLAVSQAVSAQNYTLVCQADKMMPLDNPLVRRALTLAVDKQDIIDRHYEGEGQSTPSYMIPFIGWAYNDDPALLDYIAYDPELAGQLLDEAGYPASFEYEDPFEGPTKLRFDGWDLRILVGSHDVKRYQSAITMASYWEQIGVRAHVVTTSFNLILLDVYDTGEFETYVGGYSVGVDPDWFYNLLGTHNIYRFERGKI